MYYICGFHAVFSALINAKDLVQELYINTKRQDQRMQDLLQLASNITIHHHSAEELSKLLPKLNHQGVIAKLKQLPEYGESDLDNLVASAPQPGLFLILDGITDPHNFGACLRTADACGVSLVITPKDNSAPISPVVSKVASGALEVLPIVRVTNLVRALDRMKKLGVWIYGADALAPQYLSALDCNSSVALVMGAEGSGMRRLTKEHCDALYSLPMLGTVSSLNVSVATGVSLYEVVRQRGLFA
jgi:23S rRNA (guanosine2251-2'-O)-methyltransferase